jgi:hypothetical protein
MAKKNTTSAAAKTTVAKTSTPAPESVTTAVRNTTVPPKSTAIAAAPTKKSPPTYNDIALRAYFIWKSSGGDSFHNWIRAERELAI